MSLIRNCRDCHVCEWCGRVLTTCGDHEGHDLGYCDGECDEGPPLEMR